ncbi:hypothetical protein BH10BAC3_BH10BAC3_38550 [soil metagenome]
MIFVDLLTRAGVPSFTLMTNDRVEGKIDINYPFPDQFQKLVTYVNLPGKPLLLMHQKG